MIVFSRRLSSDPSFHEYFSSNIMMQQMISTLILNFFHASSNAGENEQIKLDTFGFKLSKEQFMQT